MKFKLFFLTVVAFAFIAMQTVNAQVNKLVDDSKHVVTGNDTAHVDWTNQYVSAVGKSVIDTATWKNPVQANMMAERGAIVDAQRNLLEMIKGISIDGETTVENFMTTSDRVKTNLEGTLRLAEIVGDFEYKRGYVQVTMKAPLYQKYGVAEAIIDELPKGKEIPLVVPNGKKVDKEQEYIMNLKTTSNEPVLFPKLYDNKGNLILDTKTLQQLNNGQVPPLYNLTEQEIKDLQEKANLKVLDFVEDAKGQFKAKTKFDWDKIINVATMVGKIAMTFM